MPHGTRYAIHELSDHVVSLPKNGELILTGTAAARESFFAGNSDDKDIELAGATSMDDPVHSVVESPPRRALSLMVEWLKDIPARWYTDRHDDRSRLTRSFHTGTAGCLLKDPIEPIGKEPDS